MSEKIFSLTEGAKRVLEHLAKENPEIYTQVYQEAAFTEEEIRIAGSEILQQNKEGIEIVFNMDEHEGKRSK